MIDAANVDPEDGFFMIENPSDNTIYFDRSKVIKKDDPFFINKKYDFSNIVEMTEDIVKNNLYTGLVEVDDNGISISEDDYLYRLPYMVPDNSAPRGIVVKTSMIPFRAALRATFYYTAQEKYSERFTFDKSTPFDSLKPLPQSNPGYLAGVYPPQELTIDKKIFVFSDSNMIWQLKDSSNYPLILDEGETVSNNNFANIKVLQSSIITNDKWDTGRIYAELGWYHRNDLIKILDKAKRYYESLSMPVIGGYIIVPEMLFSGSSLSSMDAGSDGIGFGSLISDDRYLDGGYLKKPICEISHSFPEITATIGFDLRISTINDKFDPQLPVRIRAIEHFSSISEKKKEKEAAKKQSTVTKQVEDEPIKNEIISGCENLIKLAFGPAIASDKLLNYLGNIVKDFADNVKSESDKKKLEEMLDNPSKYF